MSKKLTKPMLIELNKELKNEIIRLNLELDAALAISMEKDEISVSGIGEYQDCKGCKEPFIKIYDAQIYCCIKCKTSVEG